MIDSSFAMWKAILLAFNRELRLDYCVCQGSHGYGKSWKKLSWKVMENLLIIESHEILLRAENFFFNY